MENIQDVLKANVGKKLKDVIQSITFEEACELPGNITNRSEEWFNDYCLPYFDKEIKSFNYINYMKDDLFVIDVGKAYVYYKDMKPVVIHSVYDPMNISYNKEKNILFCPSHESYDIVFLDDFTHVRFRD